MEYSIVEATQWCKSTFADAFFNVISWFGTELFFLIVFTALYWTYRKEFALKFGLFYLVSVGINGFLKVVINRTRPNGQGHSFPSGHSQSYAVQAGMIGYEVFKSPNVKKSRKWIVVAELIIGWIFVAYSRLYLNKHFLTDVLAGLLIALIIAIVCNMVWDTIPAKFKTLKIKRIFMYILMAGSLAIYIAFSISQKMLEGENWLTIYNMAGAIIGICAGDMLNDKFVTYKPSEDKFSAKILKAALGFGVMALYYYFVVLEWGNKLAYLLPPLYMVMMFIVTFVFPIIFQKWSNEDKRISNIKDED